VVEVRTVVSRVFREHLSDILRPYDLAASHSEVRRYYENIPVVR